MKKALIAALAWAMLVPAVSLAQNVPTPAVQTPSSCESRQAAKPRTVVGVVGADARTFLDAKNSPWTVANPAALSGFENQRVQVKYVLAIDRSQIQILSVKLAQPETQNAAYKMDSAFRR